MLDPEGEGCVGPACWIAPRLDVQYVILGIIRILLGIPNASKCTVNCVSMAMKTALFIGFMSTRSSICALMAHR
jgi:hypothetical protein